MANYSGERVFWKIKFLGAAKTLLLTKNFAKFPGNFQDNSGNFPGNVREFSRKFPGNVQDISGKFSGIVQEMSGKCPGKKSEHIDDEPIS